MITNPLVPHIHLSPIHFKKFDMTTKNYGGFIRTPPPTHCLWGGGGDDDMRSYSQTILHTFPELTSSNTKIFRVTGKQYYILFQSLHQTILTFSESYWQTILHTFPEIIPSNTDIFREFLPN